ncbi:ribonuclease VapC [Betaproteobacteria bacterium]|nr:ribonuclease VapC [Betaproteobacteria bacterium]
MSFFLDTNILLYTLTSDTAKADRAESLMKSGIISVQVLNEIACAMRRKFKLSWQETLGFLALVQSFCPAEPLTIETHTRGLIVAERYGLSIYDAMIAASALIAKCDVLYSENMHHGLIIDDQLRICNPFLQ